MSTNVRLVINVKVTDPVLLCDNAVNLGCSQEASLADKVKLVVLEIPSSLPGARVLDSRIGPHVNNEGYWRCEVDVEVMDATVLVQHADALMTESWGCTTQVGGPLSDALFEVFCGSNSRPAPCDLGFLYV